MGNNAHRPQTVKSLILSSYHKVDRNESELARGSARLPRCRSNQELMVVSSGGNREAKDSWFPTHIKTLELESIIGIAHFPYCSSR
jgi:hypothetical protein